MRRAWHYVRPLFTWQVAGPVVAYALTALMVALVVEAFVARREAFDAQQATRNAASRRIDQLQGQIDGLQTRLRRVSTDDARERGRLEEAIAALAEQIRQMGGRPVVTGGQPPNPSPASHPGRSPNPTSSPQPTGSPTPSRTPAPPPTPSPSPSCDLLHHPLRCLQEIL